MDNETIKILIDKYLNGSLSPEEAAQLNAWYASLEVGDDYTSRLTNEQAQALEDELLKSIQQRTAHAQQLKKQKIWVWMASSAAVLLVCLSLLFYWYNTPTLATETTAYGQIRDIELSDGSTIKLNGNSRITYAKKMMRQREVWFEGEGSFRIQKAPSLGNFIVHLDDTLSVEVLGTEFNLSKRSSGTRVALKNGRVQVHYSPGMQRQIIDMAPNDILIVNAGTIDRRTAADIDAYFAWERNKLELDDTSLQALFDHLQETYGLSINSTDTMLLSRTASGSIPSGEDRQLLMTYISALYDVEITSVLDHPDQFIVRDQP